MIRKWQDKDESMISCKLCIKKHQQLMKKTPCEPCQLPDVMRLPEKRKAAPMFDELRIMQTYREIVSDINQGGALTPAIVSGIWGPDVDTLDAERIRRGLMAINGIVRLDEKEIDEAINAEQT